MRCRFLGTRYFVLHSHRRLGGRLCLICVHSRVVFRWLFQLNGSSYVIHLRVFDFPIFDLLALRLMIRSTVGSTLKMSESDRQVPVIVEIFYSRCRTWRLKLGRCRIQWFWCCRLRPRWVRLPLLASQVLVLRQLVLCRLFWVKGSHSLS
jgi:hypothetical protein